MDSKKVYNIKRMKKRLTKQKSKSRDWRSIEKEFVTDLIKNFYYQAKSCAGRGFPGSYGFFTESAHKYEGVLYRLNKGY